MAAEADKTTIITQGLQSAFWEQILKPFLVEQSKLALRSVLKKTADDDINRGKFAAFEATLNYPDLMLQELQMRIVERERTAHAQNLENFRAEHGFRTPFKPAPAPGDLTQNESDQSSSDGQPV